MTDTATSIADSKTETEPFGAGCNTVMNKATAITQTKGTGSAPSFMGGAVSDGTYAMTKWEVFGKTPSTTPITETLIVKGTKWEMVAQSGTITARSNFDATLGFTDITLTPTCPAGGKAQTSPYTATSTKIVSGKTDGSELVTFTKL